MHPSDPVSRRGDASIRPLQTVQISPSYSPRFGPHVIANGAMSGPWPQTNRQTDAPSLNSYLDCIPHSRLSPHLRKTTGRAGPWQLMAANVGNMYIHCNMKIC